MQLFGCLFTYRVYIKTYVSVCDAKWTHIKIYSWTYKKKTWKYNTVVT